MYVLTRRFTLPITSKLKCVCVLRPRDLGCITCELKVFECCIQIYATFYSVLQEVYIVLTGINNLANVICI